MKDEELGAMTLINEAKHLLAAADVLMAPADDNELARTLVAEAISRLDGLVKYLNDQGVK